MKGVRKTDQARVTRAYQTVADTLLREIEGGRYQIGANLPTEEQLSSRFSVSRSTVRAALAQLEKHGMIVRRRKTGTILKALTPTDRYAVAVGSLSELLVFLDSTLVRPEDAVDVVATTTLAADLGCAPGERWIRVRTLRTPAGDKLPISWTEYYLQPRFRSVVAQIGKRPGPVYPLIERKFKVSIARIEQDIGACLMPPSLAKRLSTGTDSAALRVIHRMVSAKDGTLYCTVSLYPADRFRYVQALKRAE
ncbi:MAG: GntR family transcriptional regulator [Proteobacteria bacterium]|nr:GntR family transcriptional regulator [Pseudomonadota bacterium]